MAILKKWQFVIVTAICWVIVLAVMGLVNPTATWGESAAVGSIIWFASYGFVGFVFEVVKVWRN